MSIYQHIEEEAVVEEPPPEELDLEELNSVTAALPEEDHTHWKIVLDDVEASLQSETLLKKNQPDQYRDSCQKMQGIWQKIGFFNERNVYRQEPIETLDGEEKPLNSYELFLFWSEDVENAQYSGWYVADMVVSFDKNAPRKERQRSAKASVYAFAPCSGTAFPMAFHVPANSDQLCSALTVMTLHEWADKEIQFLNAEIEDMKLKAEGKNLKQAALTGYFIDRYTVGKGWFERCAGLVRLVLRQRWTDASGLADELRRPEQMKRKLTETLPLSSVTHTSVFGRYHNKMF